MTERQWWSRYVRPALHRPVERFLALKVEDKFKAGAPDVDLLCDGVAAKLELKFTKAPLLQFSHAARLLSANQKLWLRDWYRANGLALVLIGHEETRTATLWLAEDLIEHDADVDPPSPLIVVRYGKRAAEESLLDIRDLPAFIHAHSVT